MRKKDITIGFISTYPPRECGIATYTQNLIVSIQKNNPKIGVKVIAINDQGKLKYPNEVVFSISQQDTRDYIKAAKFINQSDIDIISLQHEYGIFGGFNGKKILYLLKYLKKPVVITVHSVPILQKQPFSFTPKRYKSRTKLLKEMFKYAKYLTVMNSLTKDYIQKHYNFKGKVKVIFHGVPEILKNELESYRREKNELGFDRDDFVISSYGLITPPKGIEYVIKSIPSIIKNNPNKKIKYLIAGRIHPKFSRSYLLELKDIARKNNLQDNVIFDSRYLTFKEIYKYLANTDIFVTPYYKNLSNLSSSGTLSYALALGCCVVSTPYIYARDLISKYNVGEFIKFKDTESIKKVITKLINNPKRLSFYQHNAFLLSRKMVWSKVAEDFTNLFHNIK